MFGLFSGIKRSNPDTKNGNESTSKITHKYDCIIYTRISSSQQISLEQQEQACKNFIMNKNYKIKDVIQEVSSARNINNLKKLQKIIRNNYDITIIVYSIDRFCRNTVDGIQILKTMADNKIKLLAVQDNIDFSSAAGRHAFRQRLSAAELESDLIGERVQRAINFKKQKNHYFGKAKYGYSLTTQIIDGMKINTKIINEDEQKILKFINIITSRRVSINFINSELAKICENFVDPIEIYQDDVSLDANEKIYLTNESIANILNDYQISYRGKAWLPRHIAEIRNTFYENIDNINVTVTTN